MPIFYSSPGICLQKVKDRTVIIGCKHDSFCFSCLCVWTELRRTCPLCSHPIGPYLIHNLWVPSPHPKVRQLIGVRIQPV